MPDCKNCGHPIFQRGKDGRWAHESTKESHGPYRACIPQSGRPPVLRAEPADCGATTVFWPDDEAMVDEIGDIIGENMEIAYGDMTGFDKAARAIFRAGYRKVAPDADV